MGPEAPRPSAKEIYGRVMDNARDELGRPASRLAFSGLFAGATIGFSALAAALVHAALPHARAAELLAALAYPIGFVAVILGRAQLFTENTLYPVALALAERGHVRRTVRLWAVVFATNVVGALLFAVLVVESGAIGPGVVGELSRLGVDVAAGSTAANFWSAVIAGWLLALVAWLVEAADAAVGQAVVIWSLVFVLALGQFDHSVASAAEVLSATVHGDIGVGRAIGWTATALVGNAVGGVLIVTLLNYGQVREAPAED